MKYNKPENCPYVFAPKCKPKIWNKNLTTVQKGHNIGRGYLSSRLSEKMKPLAKNVPGKSKWLFGDDLNKKINKISSTNTALITHIISMIIIMVAKHVAINTTMVQKTLKLPGGVLL